MKRPKINEKEAAVGPFKKILINAKLPARKCPCKDKWTKQDEVVVGCLQHDYQNKETSLEQLPLKDPPTSVAGLQLWKVA